MIHSASTAYIWENVYCYDKEFRQHISRFPTRMWNVILQQAWTMILKDRIKYDNSGKGGHHGKRKGICKRFNQGRCTYGLSCHYEHRCSVPKCGKFRHRANNCQMCNTNNPQPGTSSEHPTQPSESSADLTTAKK